MLQAEPQQGWGGGWRGAYSILGSELRGPGLSRGAWLSLERSVELRWGFAEEARLVPSLPVLCEGPGPGQGSCPASSHALCEQHTLLCSADNMALTLSLLPFQISF